VKRVRSGIAAVAGNHVVIEASPGGPYLLMAHLQHGSLCVSAGQRIEPGDPVGACGNTGNSTQPHVHLQAVDSLDWDRAQAVPIMFRSYRVVATGKLQHDALPGEAETIARH
jgi:murein DD-endopeptidase MepM/ murein hydrolase activator NlpD